MTPEVGDEKVLFFLLLTKLYCLFGGKWIEAVEHY